VRRADLKAKAKASASAAATTARADAASALHRNRKQLTPWLLAAPYAVLGEAGWLLATFNPDATPAGVAMVAAVLAGAVTWLVWRRALAARTPSGYTDRMRAGLALLCSWAAAMPLAGAQAGMWLALIAGIAWLGLPWWRQHAHPVPAPRDENTAPAAPVEQRDSTARARRVRAIGQAWAQRIATAEGGAIPGSTLTWLESTEVIDRYVIQLDPAGKVTRKDVKNQHHRIGLAVGVVEEKLSFEYTDSPATVVMQHLVGDPVFAYEGPVILCNGTPVSSRWEITPGADVDIVFGSYLDGKGHVSYRFITKGSVNSAFLLGGMGSGKTRTAEIIAIGLRMLGCYLLWIDGQDGASSPLLNEHANETFEFNMHDRSDDHGVREFTAAIGAISGKRNNDLKTRPELGGAYTYDPHRPPVVGLMDEAHELFQTLHPSESTYGHKLAAYAVQARKCGMALVALSQDYDQSQTFGGSGRLREALVTSGNLIAMRQTNKSRVGMLPSTCPPLDTVPDTGFGYLPLQQRPDALWRTLSLGANAQETAQQWMRAYEPGVLEFDRATTNSTTAVPHEDTSASGSGDSGSVVRFPGSTPGDSAPVDRDVSALTEAEQRTLAVVQGEPQTPTTLAACLGITSQGAGKKLKALVSKGFAVGMEDGRYMAR
jgi:hypothetical protein